MSKASDKIIEAWQKGNSDRINRIPYQNPYKKNSEKSKYKAYHNGFHQ